MMTLRPSPRTQRWSQRAHALLITVLLGTTMQRVPMAQAGDDDAIAIINGKPLPRQKVVELLMESHGLAIMQQLIVLELAKQETDKRGMSVSAAEVRAEFEQSLDRIAAAGGSEGPIDEESKRQALQTLLDQKGLSMAEFMVGMERNAHLRKLIEKDLKITDATLREEFARTRGERVQIRHIQVAESRDLNEALELLNKGTDFGDVARRLSQNTDSAARGGELPPFSFDDATIPAVLREASFSLAAGEVSSPIRVEKWFHIVKLERRIPPENVRFEDVKAEVEASLRQRVIPQEMNRMATELFQKAKIKVIDSKLKDGFDKLMKQNAAAGQ